LAQSYDIELVFSCVACHRNSGEGGRGGGLPLNRKMDPQYMVSIITNGGTKMPGFGGEQVLGDPLSPENIRDVVVHVMSSFQEIVLER
jgi:mono/diheme cytochrome c family protein